LLQKKVSGVRFQVSAVSVGEAHPTKFVWERFSTAIKIDRIPLFDISRLGVFACSIAYTFHLDGFGHCLL